MNHVGDIAMPIANVNDKMLNDSSILAATLTGKYLFYYECLVNNAWLSWHTYLSYSSSASKKY